MDSNILITFVVCIKGIIKLIGNSIIGGVIIFLINLIGANLNFHIGLNIGTSLLVGILGIPGAVLLVVLTIFLT